MLDNDKYALPAPTGLMCCLLDQPDRAAITTPHPTFSWIFNANRENAVQLAWQIRITRAGEPDAVVYDTGRVESSQSAGVRCEALTLEPDTAYHWQIRVWDDEFFESDWSQPQAFTTGTFRADQLEAPDSSHKFTVDCYPIETTAVRPASITTLPNGNLLLDFGRAGFASLDLTLTCPGGCNVAEVHIGEALASEGHLTANLASGSGGVCRDPGKTSVRYHKAILPLQQGRHTYRVPLAGEKDKRRMPRAIGEVMPFRFVEIASLPGAGAAEFKPADARMNVAHYRFDDNDARFECSDDLLNRVWELCRYSMKATSFCGLFVDGDRERLPYEADAYINQLGYYCTTREYTIARYSHEFLIFNPTWPTEWHLHSVMMAWADYQYTGDDTSIRAFYDDLKAKTLTALARADGLISTLNPNVPDDVLRAVHFTNGRQLRDVVDWPLGERDGFELMRFNAVVNAFHYHALGLMGRIAGALGNEGDMREHHARAEMVRDSFNRAFFNESTGLYVDGEGSSHSSQHANMLALCFGLVPDERRPRVLAFVKSKGMACSVYASQYLLEALFNHGAADHAIALMTADNDRSWKFMLDQGATITWEAWANHYKPNQDWNHAWGAAPANIIPRKLMGIEPVKPGFALIRIAPQPGNLDYAKITHPTICGPVIVEYTRTASGYELIVELPANTHAAVSLKGIVGNTDHDNVVGSGRHVFRGST